jgi:hypothetical protein
VSCPDLTSKEHTAAALAWHETTDRVTGAVQQPFYILLHPATPRGDDQAVMPTPRGRRQFEQSSFHPGPARQNDSIS